MENYKQYDGRWGGLPYAGETISGAGCGPTSCSDIIGDIDPAATAGWLTLHGFAAYRSGTYWEGIPAVLNAYGVKASQMNFVSLYGVKSSAVFDAFKRHIQAGGTGVLLMGRGRFTSGGHYIAIVGYADSKYLVYDPAGRQDGWHPWSDFIGEIKILYTTEQRWKSAVAYTFAVPGLRKGTNSRAVTLFERLLAPKNIYKGPSDTIYGDGCVAACKKVQALRNLPETGECMLTEWKVITGLPNEGNAFKLEEVRNGSTGSSVVFVQLILKAFGIYTGAVDGQAGALTEAAIKEFQKRMKLTVDGIAGAKTLQAIVGF